MVLCCDPATATVVIIALFDPADPGHQRWVTTGQRGRWVLLRFGAQSLVKDPFGNLPASRTSTAWATWSTPARPSEWSRTTLRITRLRSGRCRLVRAQWRDSAGGQPVAGWSAAVDIPVAYDENSTRSAARSAVAETCTATRCTTTCCWGGPPTPASRRSAGGGVHQDHRQSRTGEADPTHPGDPGDQGR